MHIISEDKELFEKIVNNYNVYIEILSPLKKYPRYAVQGDISDCNLYSTCLGDVEGVMMWLFIIWERLSSCDGLC